MSSIWDGASAEKPLARGKSIMGQVMEFEVERRPSCFEVCQTSGASKGSWKVGRPIVEDLKGPTCVGRSFAKALKRAKALGGL